MHLIIDTKYIGSEQRTLIFGGGKRIDNLKMYLNLGIFFRKNTISSKQIGNKGVTKVDFSKIALL